MNLTEYLAAPWAILPDRLLEMQAIYARHLSGETADFAGIEAALGRPLANEQKDYSLRDGGVAVLPVYGTISNKANMFTRVSGGASAQLLTEQVHGMRADPKVKSAILEFDSPGGSVFGTPELAAAVKLLASEKPTVSVSTGLMASAAYWIGSSANSIYASGPTDMLGSIGVVMTHNYNPRERGATTEITAGKYKRMGTDLQPLDPESRAYLQAQVDDLYAVFVDAVAANRRVSADEVLSRMADGKTFIGQRAMDAGLIDGFATVNDLAERMATDPSKFAKRRKAVFALGALPDLAASAVIEAVGEPTEAPAAEIVAAAAEALVAEQEAGPVQANAAPPTPSQEVTMTTPKEAADKFAAENPEAAALLRAEGASAEIERIQGVRAQGLPGHEALTEKLAFNGKTSPAEAAMAINEAERKRHQAGAAAHLAAGRPPVASAQAETDPAQKPNKKRLPNGSAALARLNNPASMKSAGLKE